MALGAAAGLLAVLEMVMVSSLQPRWAGEGPLGTTRDAVLSAPKGVTSVQGGVGKTPALLAARRDTETLPLHREVAHLTFSVQVLCACIFHKHLVTGPVKSEQTRKRQQSLGPRPPPSLWWPLPLGWAAEATAWTQAWVPEPRADIPTTRHGMPCSVFRALHARHAWDRVLTGFPRESSQRFWER